MLAGLQEVPVRVLRHKDWLRSEMRVSINRKKVEQYAREKAAGHRFPSPVAFVDPEEMYWLGDGFHRVEAEAMNGREAVEVYVKAGTVKDAILWNLKANRESQGLPFGAGDIKKACKVMLTSECFAGMSQRQIAKAIGCSESSVSAVARELGLPKHINKGPRFSETSWDVAAAERMRQEGASFMAIAKKLGVSSTTVRVRLGQKEVPCPHCAGTGKVLRQDTPEAGGASRPAPP